MMDKVKEITEWLDLQVSLIQSKFATKEANDVIYQDISLLPIGIKTAIAKYVDVELIIYNDDYFVAKCWMTNATLNKHYHSDYQENFIVITGEMMDNINLELHLKKGDKVSYEVGQVHEPTSVFCKLLIIGIKK